MDWTLEVVVLPVSDIARSIEFYRDQVGFNLDHHTQNEHMNVAQDRRATSGVIDSGSSVDSRAGLPAPMLLPTVGRAARRPCRRSG